MRASRSCFSSRLRENYMGTPERRSTCVWTIKEYSRRMLKKTRLLNRSTVRAKTRFIPCHARPQLRNLPSFYVSHLTFHGFWERSKNAAGGLFQQPAKGP